MKTHYKAVIIDDESDSRELIALLLGELFPFVEIAGMADGLSNGRKLISEQEPDLLFLDVEMGEGTGLDLLSSLPESSCLVIFVTAYEQYAIQALRASALDYLLKPLNREEFIVAVRNAIEKLKQQKNITSVVELVSDLHRQLEVRKIGIPGLTGIVFEDVDQVIFCEAVDNYSALHFEAKPKALISKTLGALEEELIRFGFLRIHHKYLVNLKKVHSYNKGKGGGSITMTDKTELVVSARKKASLMRVMFNGSMPG